MNTQALMAAIVRREQNGFFDSMNILRQRVYLADYIQRNPDSMQEALSDCLDFKQLFTAWRANDGTRILQLLDQALSNALGDRIDEEHEDGL